MPPYPRPPQWDDVRFDHQLAEAAVTALRLTATAVVTAAEHRATLAVTATQDWRGPDRDAFSLCLARVQAIGAELAALLLAQAAEITRAADAAHAEQRHRLADRERYRDDVRREDLAAGRHEAA